MRTLVVQSCARARSRWVDACMESVQAWAERDGHGYEFLGDELLDLAPGWVRRRSPSLLPVTDVARLALLRDRLGEEWERVVWLDADVAVRWPLPLGPEPIAACAEHWVTGAPGGGLQVVSLTCNAVLAATWAPAVDELLEVTLDEAARYEFVFDRALGPDLLSGLRLPVVAGTGVASPSVVRDLAAGGGRAVDRLIEAHDGELPLAMNLCSSLSLDADTMTAAVEKFLAS